MRAPLAILLATTLAAGVATGARYPKFEDVDVDGNGKLNESEAIQAGVDLESADQDGDGMLSKAEYQAAIQGEATRDD